VTSAVFDELIHPSTRLSIVALLAAADWVEFAFIRDQLGMSDSALSKQLSTLEEAGYVHLERPVNDRRRRVSARLTPTGRNAFRGHVAALRSIVGAADAWTLAAAPELRAGASERARLARRGSRSSSRRWWTGSVPAGRAAARSSRLLH
jgi:DNA-binding MarR family transcriptional regulator